jgi:hypothetical protein
MFELKRGFARGGGTRLLRLMQLCKASDYRNATPKAGTGSGEIGDHQKIKTIRHGRSRVPGWFRWDRGTGVSLRR